MWWKMRVSVWQSLKNHLKENQALNVFREIKGLANSSQSLDEYFLAAVKMSNIVATFCNKFRIS